MESMLALTGDGSQLDQMWKSSRLVAERDGGAIEAVAKEIAVSVKNTGKAAKESSRGLLALNDAIGDQAGELVAEKAALDALNVSLNELSLGLQRQSEVYALGVAEGEAYIKMLESGVDVNTKYAKKTLETAKALDRQQDEQEALTNAGRGFKKQLENQILALKVQRGHLEAGNAEIEARIRLERVGEKVTREYADEIIRLARAVDKADKEMEQAKKGGDKLTGTFNKIKTGAFAVTSILATISALGVSNAFASINREYVEFSDRTQEIEAITGQTGKSLDFLANNALNLSLEFGRAGKEVQTAITLTASARPELLSLQRELIDTTDDVLTLAKAADLELGASAKAVGVSLNQFQRDALGANEAINVLAAGSKFGSSQVLETAAALEKFGGVADAADQSFETANALVQTLAKGGLTAQVAGTQAKIIYQRLENQLDEGLKPSVVGLVTAFEELERRDADLFKLFGAEAQNAAIILRDNIGFLEEMESALEGTSIAEEQAAARANSLKGDLDKLGASVSKLKVELGEFGEAFSRSLVDDVNEVVTALGNLVEIANSLGKLSEEELKLFNNEDLSLSAEILASSLQAVDAFKEGSLKEPLINIPGLGAIIGFFDGVADLSEDINKSTSEIQESLSKINEEALDLQSTFDTLSEISKLGPFAAQTEAQLNVLAHLANAARQEDVFRSNTALSNLRDELEAMKKVTKERSGYNEAVRRAIADIQKETKFLDIQIKTFSKGKKERELALEVAKRGFELGSSEFEQVLEVTRAREEQREALEELIEQEERRKQLSADADDLLESIENEIALIQRKINGEEKLTKAQEARLALEQDFADLDPEKLVSLESQISLLETLTEQYEFLQKLKPIALPDVDLAPLGTELTSQQQRVIENAEAFGYLTREMRAWIIASDEGKLSTQALNDRLKELDAKALAGQFQETLVDTIVGSFSDGFSSIFENWEDLLGDMLGEWQKSNLKSILNGDEAIGLGDAFGLQGTAFGDFLNKPAVGGAISGFAAGTAAADQFGFGTTDAQIQGTLGGLLAGASTGNIWAAVAGAAAGALASGVLTGTDWTHTGYLLSLDINQGIIDGYQQFDSLTQDKPFFGGSDERFVTANYVNDGLRSEVIDGINSVRDTVLSHAAEIGLSTAQETVDAYDRAFNIDLSNMSSPEQMQAEIERQFRLQQNSFALAVLPQIGAFVDSAFGEDFTDTLDRLNASSKAVNDQFVGMGLNVEDFINQGVLDTTLNRLEEFQKELVGRWSEGLLTADVTVNPDDLLGELSIDEIRDRIQVLGEEVVDLVDIPATLFELALIDFKERMAAAAGGAEELTDIFQRYTSAFENSQEFLDRTLLDQIDKAEQAAQTALDSLGSSRQNYVADLDAALASGTLTPEEVTAFFEAGALLSDLMALERQLAQARGVALDITSLTADQLIDVNAQTEVLNQNMEALGLSAQFAGQDLLNLEAAFGSLGDFQSQASSFFQIFSTPEQIASAGRANGERVLQEFGVGIGTSASVIQESVRQLMVDTLEAGNFEEASRIFDLLGPAASAYLDVLREEEQLRQSLVDATLAFNQQMNILHPGITLSVDAMSDLADAVGGLESAGQLLDDFYSLIDGTSFDTFDPSSFLPTFGVDMARLASEGSDYLAQIAGDAFQSGDFERFRIIMQQIVPVAQNYIDSLDDEAQARRDLLRATDQFNDSLYGLGSNIALSAEQFDALAESVGGAGELNAGLGFVFDSFLSTAEQSQIQWNLAANTIENAGYSVQQFIDLGHAGFAEMVREAAEVGNGPLLDTLLDIAPAVAQILGPLDGVGSAAQQAANSIQSLESALARVGQTAQNSIRNILSNGIAGQGPSVSLTSRISTLTGQANDAALAASRRLDIINELIPLIETQYVNTRDQIIAGQEAVQASLQATAQLEYERQRQAYDAALEIYNLEKQRYDDLIRLAQSLRGYLRDLNTGELSGLSLDARIALAQSELDAEISRTLAGTDDGGDIQNLAQQLLQISRERFASSPEFQEIFRATQDRIREVLAFVDGTKEPREPIEPVIREISTTASQLAINTASMPLIAAAQQEAVAQIDALRRQAEDLAEEERIRQEQEAEQQRLDRQTEIDYQQASTDSLETIKTDTAAQTALMDQMLAVHAYGNEQLSMLNVQVDKVKILLSEMSSPINDPLINALANSALQIVSQLQANNASINYGFDRTVRAINDIEFPGPVVAPEVVPLSTVTPGVD